MSKKINKTASEKVMSNLSDAIEMEAHLKMLYMTQHRLMKFIRYPEHKKFKCFAKDLQCELHDLMNQVFRLGGTVQYDAGTITSQNPDAVPSDSVVEILTQVLALEEDMSQKFEDFIVDSTEARDDESRNLLEHNCKYGHERIAYLKGELRWAQDLGNKSFAVSRI